jgi:DNA-binding CsgD family transcriptional regulator
MKPSVKNNDLTPREREIAKAYANGDNYHRIAERLFIAPSTVRTHLAAIYQKLGVSSKIELHKVLDGRKPQYIAEGDQAAVISELALSLEEAISRERALGEVLRIISGSNGELEKVIAAALGYALELCDAEFGILFEYTAKSGYESKYTKGIPQRQISGGGRSFAAIPMLAGERLIGAFTVYRQQVRPFDTKSLEVARMFPDQSVIAIENTRLIGEMGQQNSVET